MTRTFKARYTNGVLVPSGNVELPMDTELTVRVDELPLPAVSDRLPRFDDPADPMPAGGVELVDWWSRHRIQIDPHLAREIGESPAYLDQGSDDAS